MSTIIKRKTTMLLHQIEEALGSFVLTKGDVDSLNLDQLENIYKREVDKGRIFNKNSIKDVVEATYLDELFGFALDIAHDSSLIDSINYLYSLFHHLDIYEIRNAISHPNRPFWDCYWYRVATIASDPVNEILGLQEIKNALELIEKGIINDPPEDWISKIIWQIPNNLPDHFDHGVTGLIGRSKELADLKKYITNPRINTIALVAPGGAGKTALALDFLNTIISTPNFSKILDAVIFITLKTEKLTANGVVSLDSIQTLDELKENIKDSLNSIYDKQYETFEGIVEDLKNEKILLCIDNLETLLREKHESFEDFNNELPPTWQVLITSRIVIPNATILSLDALKEKSAIHLARTYSSKRGMQPLTEDSYLELTKGCFYNPLAIRLTIDLLLTGRDIPSSLNVANKEIAEFSYNNLINVLSENSIAILEAIFVEDISTRLSLCELLNKSIDEISSAIGELSRTSLISRTSSDQGESYKLSDSVRDLLLISPKNINIRSTVQDLILKRRNLSNEIDIRQNEKEIPTWHSDYIPHDTNHNLKILVTKVNSGVKKGYNNTEIAINLFRNLKDAKHIYESNDLYHRSYGRVLELLKDYNLAEEAYKKAINCNPENPASYYLLGRLYHSTNQFDKAKDTYKILIDKGFTNTDPSIISFGKSIYTGYFLALLYSGKYDEVFDLTEEWKEAGPYRSTLGTFRAGAWKRKAESSVEESPDQTIDALFRASQILSDVFRTDGYSRVANKQAIKIFEEIEYCLSRPVYYQTDSDKCDRLLKFVFNNIFEIDQLDKNTNLSLLLSKLIDLNIPNNIFKNNITIKSDEENSDDEFFRNYTMVKITNRPKDKVSFLFAQDKTGQDFFLHYDNLKNGTWKDWVQLYLNQDLYIQYEDRSLDGKAIKASEIYLST
ncbi:tetratricopeptide repeat protein [Acinetobacter baumannii]|nr:tetratricopeptide repeat protein [Acinetobacter baumannii]